MTQDQSATASPIGGRAGGVMKRFAAIPTPVIFGFSILLAIGLLYIEGSLGDVWPTLKRADATTIVSGLLLYLAGLALLSLRWHLLVRMIKGVSHAPRAAEAFLTSVVINYAAPVSLAIPSRAALTKRALGLTAAETGAVALWEVATDVLVLAAASLLWFIVGGRDADLLPDNTGSIVLVLGALVVTAILGIGLLVVISRVKPRLWEKIVSTARTTLAYPSKRPADAIQAVVVTVIYWVAQGAVLWLLLDAIGQKPGLALVLGLISLPVLVGMLSPVPGGAGVREALMLAVAKVHGADGATVLLAAVTYRIALFGSIPILYAIVRLWLKLDPAPPLPPDPSEPATAANADLR